MLFNNSYSIHFETDVCLQVYLYDFWLVKQSILNNNFNNFRSIHRKVSTFKRYGFSIQAMRWDFSNGKYKDDHKNNPTRRYLLLDIYSFDCKWKEQLLHQPKCRNHYIFQYFHCYFKQTKKPLLWSWHYHRNKFTFKLP